MVRRELRAWSGIFPLSPAHAIRRIEGQRKKDQEKEEKESYVLMGTGRKAEWLKSGGVRTAADRMKGRNSAG
jgi:hypothetical protein